MAMKEAFGLSVATYEKEKCMVHNRPLHRVAEHFANILLALIMALNYEIFIFENAFAPAGINGLATMVQHVLGFNVGYMSLIINIPLSIAAFFLLNRDYAIKTLSFVLAFSFGLILLDTLDLSDFVYKTDNGTSTILAPIVAGTISGLIYGCTIRLNSCTGGTDVVATLIRIKRPDYNMMWLIFAINSVVAGLSYFVYDYRIEPVILCIIYSFMTSNVGERILRGNQEAIKFEIITNRAEELAQDVITHLRHSATRVSAEGMYQHKGVDMLICVVNKHQVVDFQHLLKKYPGTFAYISPVNETVGNFQRSKRE